MVVSFEQNSLQKDLTKNIRKTYQVLETVTHKKKLHYTLKVDQKIVEIASQKVTPHPKNKTKIA